MKNVLIVVNHISNGGLERVLVDVVSILANNANIQVLTLYNTQSDYLNEVKQYAQVDTLDKYRDRFNNRFYRSIYSRLYDKLYIQKILYNNYVKQKQPYIQIAFSETPTLKIVATNKTAKHQKIAWIHTDFLSDPFFIKHNSISSFKKILEKYKEVIFVSKALECKFKEYFKLNNTNCIHNAIDTKRINRQKNEEAITIADDNRITLVAIGRLSKEKGFIRLINSISKLSEEQKNKCHLIIIGGGEQQQTIENAIYQAGLEKTITLTGQLTNPYSILKKAHVLIQPSIYEGFGLVLLEAMALNVPVIATKTVGSTEVLGNGKYGMLVENTDDAFDEIIPSILENITILDSYKLLLKECLQKYSIETFKKQILKHILNS